MAERIQSSWRLKLGIGVALVGIWYWGHGRREVRHLLVASPRRGDLARVIREEARTRYRTTHLVSMPYPGRLQRHEVEEGDRVTRGQVLATLQLDLAEAALLSSREELAAAQRELELIRDTSDEKAAVAQAQARLRASEAAAVARRDELPLHQAALDLAVSERQRVADLAARGAATQAQVDRAESELRRTRALVRVSETQARAAAAEVEAARATVEQARILLSTQATRAARVQAQVAALEARLVPLRDDLRRTAVVSPIDGEVLTVMNRSEAILAPGTPLFELGDPTSLEVEVDLLSEDAVHVRPDGLYGIYGRALGGDDEAGRSAEVPAQLREVSPRGFTKRSSLGVEEQRVHAWFAFIQAPPGLGHGYRVHLRAALEVARDAILVPRRALLRDGRDWIVFLDQGGRARRRVVTPGLGDESWVVVLRGVTPEDVLLLDVPETLEEGDPVTVEPARDLPLPAPLPGQG